MTTTVLDSSALLRFLERNDSLLHEVVNDPTSALTRIPERGFGGWLARTAPISPVAASKRDEYIAVMKLIADPFFKDSK